MNTKISQALGDNKSGDIINYFNEVDKMLENIMVNIYHNIDDAAKKYGMEGNYVAGANIAGFLKVADAILRTFSTVS